MSGWELVGNLAVLITSGFAILAILWATVAITSSWRREVEDDMRVQSTRIPLSQAGQTRDD